MFVVPIGNAKNVEEIKFNTDDPMLKYRHNTSNSSCFGILASSFESVNKKRLQMLYKSVYKNH